mgnify:CR=1 FL=1
MKTEKKLTHEVCVNQTKTLLYIVSTFKKLKKFVFLKSDILHILLANSILSTTKQFRETPANITTTNGHAVLSSPVEVLLYDVIKWIACKVK